jgi:hypothetical protein
MPLFFVFFRPALTLVAPSSTPKWMRVIKGEKEEALRVTDGEGWVASKPIVPRFGPEVPVSLSLQRKVKE